PALKLGDFALDDLANGQAALAVLTLEANRRARHPGYLPNERTKGRQMAARLAREDRPQGLRLCLVRVFVEVQRHLPIAVEHAFRRADDHRGVQPAEVQVVLLPV